VLEQEEEDGLWHVVAYGSCSLSGAEKNWSATEKECFVVVHFMNHWWHFLLGAKLTICVDNVNNGLETEEMDGSGMEAPSCFSSHSCSSINLIVSFLLLDGMATLSHVGLPLVHHVPICQ